MKKPASLSLDLDNQWSYMKTHGDDGWDSYPSYLNLAVPRILEFLDKLDVKITFFIVGKDADLEKNHKVLHSIAQAGHEIGNHSYNHEPWLHLYSLEELDAELAKAEDVIEKVTGVKPVGFRGPGYSLSEKTLKVLLDRGYLYDATVFPNILNPLARAYLFKTSNLTDEQKEQRKGLFGTVEDAFRPVKPFKWNMGNGTLTEIPVTTMPIFKIPIHFSYILYLSKYSVALAKFYFHVSLFMCRITGTSPSVLLHPLDFLGKEDAGDLEFFPGMDIETTKKLNLVEYLISTLGKKYNIVTMRGHYELLNKKKNLPIKFPNFKIAE